MILKELFDKVSFDEVVPYLLPLIGGERRALHNFREAFDLIRLYEPVKGFAEEVFLRHVEPECRPGYMLVRFVDGDPWPNSLAKEVVFEDEETFADADIVANCLYEMTFYGFCEEEHRGIMDELELLWFPKGQSGFKGENLAEKMNKFIDAPQNRMKRMRFARWGRQLKRLEKITTREALLMRMQLAFPMEEISHLMNMEKGHEFSYRSTIADGDERLPYIMKSIREYQQLGKVTDFEKAYFWLHVPMNFPWPEEPWLQFQRELSEYLGLPIRFGIVSKEASCDEIGGFLLLYNEGHGRL